MIRSIEKILILLSAITWATFTLIPNSHSLMVTWGWVFLWQIGLLFPLLWFLLLFWQQKIRPLGNYWDWWVGLILFGIVISTIFADFPHQGRWYGWAAICLLAGLYALNTRLETATQRYRLILAQGYLSLMFILISLSLWLTETVLPELSRLKALNLKYGTNFSFDFSTLELRNWAPIGHQNYVAGYLLLALPIFVGLAIQQQGWRRYLWLTGLVLGSIDLYSTSSRGGWLGWAVTCLVSLVILSWRSKLPRLRLGWAGLGIFSLLSLSLFANNRLSSLLTSGGELVYRGINTYIGWQMGISRPLTGIGLGGVPLIYQKYRPDWAGKEAELAYQLHSTPMQLLAEMGIWGLLGWLSGIGLLVWLFYRHFWGKEEAQNQDNSIDYCLWASCLGYSIISFTDYQLDNLGISSTLVLFLACLTSSQASSSPLKQLPRLYPAILTGISIAILISLYPIHRGWQLSSQGFSALRNNNIEIFVEKLAAAHRLAPWEAYYSYQLGWNLGDLAIASQNPQQQQQLWQESINWLQKGNLASPYQEFGYTNLAWMLLKNDPVAATENFAQAAELVPAKNGIFSGLGIGLLLQGKTNLAVEAFTIEALRHPMTITSPIWQSPPLQSLYPDLITNLDRNYTKLRQQYPNNNYWQNCQMSLAWWQNDRAKVKQLLPKNPHPLLATLIALDEGKDISSHLAELPDSPTKLIITAWLDPSQRSALIEKAWVLANKSEIKPEIRQNHLDTMAKSPSFSQWLQKNAPFWSYRKERTGFGIVSRHLDGTTPTDFNQVTDNIPMTTWFEVLFPNSVYAPDIDMALGKMRVNLLKSIGRRSTSS
jgi:uncharacterized protein involved in response to NO